MTELAQPLPEHLEPCAGAHTGRCSVCGHAITIGPSGVEYGHRRGVARGTAEGVTDCPHRPPEVDNHRERPVRGAASTEGGA